MSGPCRSRAHADSSQNSLIFRRAIDSLLDVMLLAALLPLVVLSVIRPWLRLNSPAKSRRRIADPPPATSPIGEFHFERSVEAYESLIDAVLAEDRACATSRK